MDRHSIITLPHDNLRKRSQKVTFVSDEDKKIVDNMISASLDWEEHREHELCVGLAAVQVNILKRIVIIRANQEDRSEKTFITLINPKILKVQGTPEYDFEGCLSVRDIYGRVPRYPKVKVQALDINGQEFRITAEGFLARLIQHEVDHTNGILFVDHIKDEDEFYIIDEEDGKIKKLDFEQDVKNSPTLWEQ